ncbi:Oxidase FUB9 [Exophiala dermatitidis]
MTLLKPKAQTMGGNTSPSPPSSSSSSSSSPSQSSPSTAHDLNCLTITELETLAYERMDKQTRDYYNEGADDGSTLKENMTAYRRYRIRPRVLRDISSIDTSTTVFGQRVSVPFGVAPTAMQCLAHEDGEIATARACRAKGVAMGLSSFSTSTLEDVADAITTSGGPTTEGKSTDGNSESGRNSANPGHPPYALQLYLFEERKHSLKLINRAKRAGYKAVLLTVDTPMLGRRNLEIRNQFKLPRHLKIANFAQQGENDVDDASVVDTENRGSIGTTSTSTTKHNTEGDISVRKSKRSPPSGPITFHTHAPNPTLTWEESIPWLRKVCGSEMQVWVKGIATAEDALLALHHGVDGIIVSNHGGRQLNGALATLDALPEVVDAVQKKIPVHVDGGVRHGSDVFKALALGADFVWVGRPILWGLAYKGQAGVESCLRLLMDEFKLCMGLAGVTQVKGIGKEYLCRLGMDGRVSKL